MNPTSKPITLTLGGEKYHLYFDLNTFTAFEEASGKFFLDFLASVQETLKGLQDAVNAAGAKSANEAATATEAASFQILRKIGLKDVQTFLWAAMHEYDSNGEPYWPKTRGQVGKLIDVANISTLLPTIIQANVDNFPDAPSTTESSRPTVPKAPDESLTHVSGGSVSGPSDAEILDSLTVRSEG